MLIKFWYGISQSGPRLGLLLWMAIVPLGHAQDIPAPVTPGGAVPGQSITKPATDPLNVPDALPDETVDTEPEADTGPKIDINNIIVEGVIDREKKGITSEAVQDFVNAALAAKNEWSLGALHQLVNSVTDYFRERGFILTQAYLPEQSISDGEVVIQVIEGTLGNVIIEGNTNLDHVVIDQLFEPMVGILKTRESLETALLYASDIPGIQAKALLQRGAEPGTADLVYKVEQEDKVDVFLNLDNFGSEFVGETRGRIDLVLLNPSGRGDRLTLSGLGSFDPSNSQYVGFDYSRPYIRRANGKPVIVGVSGSKNEFEVGGDLAELNLDGESSRFDIYASHPYKRTKFDNRTVALALNLKQSETRQRQVQTSRDELSILALSHQFTKQNQSLDGGIASLTTSWAHGFGDFLGSMPAENAPDSSRLGSSGNNAGGDFDKFNFSSSLFQRLSKRVAVQLRLDGQASDDLLVSLEQFPLGGPNSVRAYPLSAFLVDEGLFASAELSVSIGRFLQASLFYDYGTGSLNQPLQSDIADVDLRGIGVALRLDVSGRVSVVASVARTAGEVAPGFEDEEDDNRVFVSVSGKLK